MAAGFCKIGMDTFKNGFRCVSNYTKLLNNFIEGNTCIHHTEIKIHKRPKPR